MPLGEYIKGLGMDVMDSDLCYIVRKFLAQP
jgi:hypothetical protein